MPLKDTPARRRALGASHTEQWLQNRQTAWDEHDAGLWHRHQQRTLAADEFRRQREESASSWRQQQQLEHEQNFPAPLPEPQAPPLEEPESAERDQSQTKPERNAPLATLEIRARPSEPGSAESSPGRQTQ